MPNSMILPFTVQPQEEALWCWAAVGTSCALYYNPACGWTQCKMATQCLHPKPTGNCCTGGGLVQRPKGCKKKWYLVDSSRQLGSLVKAKIGNCFVSGEISYDDLKKEIDAKRLVPFMLKAAFLTHFVTVRGYDEQGTQEYVVSEDSIDPKFSTTMLYSDFCNKYRHIAKVKYTFFTHP